ncbi:hypothetical protein MK079_03095 [Candidatus Gracilibacteria bacterium]|nr:hypothetical protein [Candidatus Gracilibacteria bacterium]
MKKNTQAFSLLMAMIITLIMTLVVVFILEYMIPYSRSVAGIENSARAYYQAYAGVEQALENGGTISESSAPLSSWYDVEAIGSLLPESGNGNSEYNSDWNKVRIGEPIQLSVGDNMVGNNWGNFNFYLRVPDVSQVNATLSGAAMMHWQLSAEDDSWNRATPIQASGVCSSQATLCSPFGGQGIPGINLFGQTEDMHTFYNDHCGSGRECSLKMSIISDLVLQSGAGIAANTRLPYLEWRADFGSDQVPLRFTQIMASGKSYGFKKQIQVSVPQQTVIEAFDFTVFQ